MFRERHDVLKSQGSHIRDGSPVGVCLPFRPCRLGAEKKKVRKKTHPRPDPPFLAPGPIAERLEEFEPQVDGPLARVSRAFLATWELRALAFLPSLAKLISANIKPTSCSGVLMTMDFFLPLQPQTHLTFVTSYYHRAPFSSLASFATFAL